MDPDQMMKRMEWLDDERRKDKALLASLEDRMAACEGNLHPLMQQVKELTSELSRMTAALNRFDQLESSLVQIRVDQSKGLEGVEKQRAEQSREQEKSRRADLEMLNKAIAEARKASEPVVSLKKSLQDRVDEDYRLSRMIEEVKKNLDDYRRSDEEYRRTQRILEEGRRQDTKRLTDTQVEVSALRKRVDEQRGKVELAAESVRKLEMRMTEFISTEAERKQAQISFIEKQNMLQVDRDRSMREWETRLSGILSQAAEIESQLQALDATHRMLKRAQENFEEITQKFDRRVNEITEMQRLVEERFRQEWMTFKAEDQKRWTNYTLTQEEQQRDATRQAERMLERVRQLEEASQETSDSLELIRQVTQKRLHMILETTHQLMDDYDASFGTGH